MAADKGKLLEEMTQGEYLEYLEAEAEKQAEYNREQFEKQQEAYKDAFKEKAIAGLTDKSNDELREEASTAFEAELEALKAGPKKAAEPKKTTTPPHQQPPANKP